MFTISNLKQKPFVSLEADRDNFEAPPVADVSCSDWLLLAIENNEVDKIYAMRSLPFYDIMAFKIKYVFENGPQSEIITRPELNLLKRIWDCGNVGFNRGILHYIQHSRHVYHQYNNPTKFPLNPPATNKWYHNLLLGKDV
jgi:hypothetical protein